MIRVIGTGATVYGNLSAAAPRPSVAIGFNDLELLIVGTKDTTTPASIPAPSGWTSLLTTTGGDGTTTVDQGITRLSIFSRKANGGESGNVTVSSSLTPNVGTTNYVMWAHTMVLRADKGTISTYVSNGNIASSNTTFTRTFNFFTDYSLVPAGGLFMALGVTANDTPGFTNLNISTAATGFNWYNSTQIVSQPSTDTGLDIGGFVITRSIKNPPTSGNVSVTFGSDWTTKTGGPLTMVVFSESASQPVVAWNFNETSGNATSSGSAAIPVVPVASPGRVAGRNDVGRALSAGGQANNGTTIVAAGSTSLSLHARFKWDGGSADRGILTIFDSGTDRGGIFTTGNKVGFWLDPTSGFKTVVPNFALSSGQWYDVVATWNGEVMRVWINGYLQNESTAATGTIANNIIQCQITDNAAGQPVDAARVWNRIVTETEAVMAGVLEPGWTSNTSTYRFPGAAHSSGRYLLDTLGQPYFATLDSGWNLLQGLPQSKREAYLANREMQGFNMSYVGVVRSDFKQDGTTPEGRTPAGNMPFAGASPSAWNIASPNEAFWAEVDDMLDKAEARGITLWLQVFTTWSAAAYSIYTNSTDAQVRTFGAWLGNRYKNRTNLVWLFGGDWGTPDATTTSRAEQLILGIRDSGDTHHFAMHMVEESDGHTGPWTASSTLQAQETIRPTYTYTPTYYRNRVAYASTPAKPVIMFEANYENNQEKYTSPLSNVTQNGLRRQALWTLTAGGHAGHGYGHGWVFNFRGETSGDDITYAWTTVATTLVTQQFAALAARWRALSGWQNLVPDTGNTLITSGRGTERTTWVAEAVRANDYVSAAITPDKSMGVAYVPSAREMTISLTKVGANPVVTRIDPTGETADTVLATGGTFYLVSAASLPAHADGSSDYLLKVTGDAVSSNTRKLVRGGQLVDVTRYVVRGGALVPLT